MDITKLSIAKSELEELYWNQNLSISETSKKIGLTRMQTYHQMKKADIKLRNRIKALPKFIDPMITITKEYAYIMGVIQGDGTISKSYQFKLEVKDADFAENFIKCLMKIGVKTKLKKTNPPYLRVQFRRKNLALLLNKSSFRKLTQQQKISFINGIYDSEGSIRKGSIRLAMSNKTIISDIYQIFKSFGMNPKTSTKKGIKEGYKTMYHINLHNQKSFVKFHTHFHFSIKRKQDKLDAIVKSYR